MKRTFPALLLAALSAIPALAVNQPINGNFEAAPNGIYSTGTSGSATYKFASNTSGNNSVGTANASLLTGWTLTSIGNGGTYGVITNNIFSPSKTTAGNQQALFLQEYYNGGIDAVVSNSLGTIAANSTYTLNLDIGAPPAFTLNGKVTTSGYTAPQVYFALLGNSSNVINSMTLPNTAVTENGLTNYSLTFTTGASGGFIGQSLSIELQASKALYPTNTVPGHSNGDPGGEIAIFDNLVLSGSGAPEPSSYALMLAGGGLLFFAARRRMMRS